jgi:soluble lytic murein transglycosylase-like protein
MTYVPAKFSSGKPQIDAWVDQYARLYDLDANVMLAQLWQESRFRPNAVSPVGAKGIAQFMPATARRFGLKDPFDVQASIEAQAKYMRFLLNKFGDYALALAGYNAGEGNVQKYGNKIPPFKETQNYVKSILGRIEQLAGYNPSKKKKIDITAGAEADVSQNEKVKMATGFGESVSIWKSRNTRVLIATFLILIIIYFVLKND